MAAKKGNKYAEGNKGGRPSKYKKEYCKSLIDFFTVEPYELVVLETSKEFYKEGGIKKESSKKRPMPNKMPTFYRFSKKIGVSMATLENWKIKHKEFLEAYNEAKELQKEFLINNGLAGSVPPASFIFVAKNVTDMSDKQSVELSGNISLTKLFEKANE